MTTLSFTKQPVIIAKANPNRTALLIGNLSDTTVYVSTNGDDIDFEDRAWPIGYKGTFDRIHGPGCYKGPIFAMTSAASDIRIFEV